MANASFNFPGGPEAEWEAKINNYVKELTEKDPGLSQENCTDLLEKYVAMPECLLTCLFQLHCIAKKDQQRIQKSSFIFCPWQHDINVLYFLLGKVPPSNFCNHFSCVQRCLLNSVLYKEKFLHPNDIKEANLTDDLAIVKIRLAFGVQQVFKDRMEDLEIEMLTPAEKEERINYFRSFIKSGYKPTRDQQLRDKANAKEISEQTGRKHFYVQRKIWDWPTKTYHLECDKSVRYDGDDQVVATNWFTTPV